jgi:hypothetical protein
MAIFVQQQTPSPCQRYKRKVSGQNDDIINMMEKEKKMKKDVLV